MTLATYSYGVINPVINFKWLFTSQFLFAITLFYNAKPASFALWNHRANSEAIAAEGCEKAFSLAEVRCAYCLCVLFLISFHSICRVGTHARISYFICPDWRELNIDISKNSFPRGRVYKNLLLPYPMYPASGWVWPLTFCEQRIIIVMASHYYFLAP